MMATLSSSSNDMLLKTFSASLEDLTFNSKPIIDDLTRFASNHKQFGPQIVQKLEEHILEVRPEWKLPSLYLLDSILKNLKGDYSTWFSKNIVHVFCHCFEKLVDPDARKSLYKLRQTWPQYFQNRKLALIDRHVKVLDPNWPITAVEKDPPSPTIFVNPKFLEPNDNSSQSSSQSGPADKDSLSKRDNVKAQAKPRKELSKSPSKVVVSPPSNDSRQKKGGNMSIQEKRKKLLHEKKTERMKQQEAMGLSSDKHLKVQKKSSDKSCTPPGSRGSSPLTVQSSRASPKSAAAARRSASPRVMNRTNHVGGKSGKKHKGKKEVAPPPEKRPKLDCDSEPELMIDVPKQAKSKKVDEEDTRPLKESHLQLDDIPRELLPKHHELILKQIESQLNTGNLSSEQHTTLCKQLDQLYALQKLKDEEDKPLRSSSPHSNSHTKGEDSVEQDSKEQTDTSKPDNARTIPEEEFISLSNTKSDSVFFVDTSGANDNLDLGPAHRGSRGGYHGRPHPHSFEDRHYADRPPRRPYRGDVRPPFRSRRGGRPYYPRRPRGGNSRYFDGSDGPPPSMGPERGSGRMLPGPPPPHWHEQPPPQGGGYGMPPPLGPVQPPQLNVSQLLGKLVDFGMIGGNESSSQSSDGLRSRKSKSATPEPGMDTQSSQGSMYGSAPVTLPTLSFTPATLKQKYSALISLIHVGEQCSTCGVRFSDRSGDVFRKHLDWHYSLNRMESEGLVNTSRNWFIHPEDWLKFEELSEESQEKDITLKPSGVVQEEQEQSTPCGETVNSCQVLSGEGNEVCNICQEALEQFWEEDLEEWHFKDAIRSPAGKLYHTFCFQDANEEDLNASGTSTQLPSPVEIEVDRTLTE